MSSKHYYVLKDGVISTATKNSTAPVSSGGLYKRIQSGTAEPASGFSGTPVAGDIYIKY